jgi:hypothetical protein
MRFGQTSSLGFLERERLDKDYSIEDICFPLVKGSHKEGSLNYEIDSPRMEDLGVLEDLSWKKCSKELTCWMKYTWAGGNY